MKIIKMKNGFVLLACLFVLPFLANAQYEKIDSLNNLLGDSACTNEIFSKQLYKTIDLESKKIKYTKGAIISYKHLGTMMHCLGKPDSAIHFFRLGAQLGSKSNHDVLSGKLYSNVGYIFQMSGQYDSSQHHFNKALVIAKALNNEVLLGAIYTGMGIVLQQKGQLDSAISIYIEASKWAEQTDLSNLKLTVEHNISTIHYNHFPERINIESLKNNLDLAKKIGDLRTQVSFIELLAYIESDRSKHEEAINHFKEGLVINQTLKHQNVNILMFEGLAYAYGNKGDFQEATRFFKRAIAASESSGILSNLPKLYIDNASAYLKLGLFVDAEMSTRKGIEYINELEQKEFSPDAYLYLAKALYGLKRFDEAYDAQSEYIKVNSALLDIEKSKQMTEMQTKYETEKKEAEIITLNQQAAIQSMELTRKNQWMLIGVILISFLAVIAYLIYNQRRIKAEQVKSEIEQRFLRSQLNPHFIFNALLAIQNFMLKNDAPKAAFYLSKFSKLMREILENSRKSSVSISEEVDMLTNYLDIHKLRLNNAFSYEMRVDESIDAEMDGIPSMFIQPFVENAIEHGMAGKSEGGQIDIAFSKESDMIVITIMDNGEGISAHKDSSETHQSLASKIISERMTLDNKRSKKKLSFEISETKSTQGQVLGTCVKLKLPILA